MNRTIRMLGIALVFSGVAISAPGFWLLTSRNQYKSVARIKFDSQADLRCYDTRALENKFEIMQSPSVLSNVAARLNLTKQRGGRYVGGNSLTHSRAVALLNHAIRLSPVDEAQVDVSFISEDFREAQYFANAAAEVFCEPETWWLPGANLNEILQTDIEIAREGIKAAQADMNRLNAERNLANTFAEKSDAKLKLYLDATDKLNNMEKLRDALEIRLNSSWKPPPPVHIVHPAKLDPVPIGPNRVLGSALLGLGVIFVLGGLIVKRLVIGK